MKPFELIESMQQFVGNNVVNNAAEQREKEKKERRDAQSKRQLDGQLQRIDSLENRDEKVVKSGIDRLQGINRAEKKKSILDRFRNKFNQMREKAKEKFKTDTASGVVSGTLGLAKRLTIKKK